MPDLRVTEPLGYLEFLNLMANARLMLTDSGGIQEETTILGVPFGRPFDKLRTGSGQALPDAVDEPGCARWRRCVQEYQAKLALKEKRQLLELMGLCARRG